MNLSPIVTYLHDQGLGVKGVNLFRNNMPSRIERGILVTQQTMGKRHPDAIAYIHANFEIIARDATFDGCDELMNGVTDAITSDGLQLGNMKFFYIRPYNLPLVYPLTDADQCEASVLFDCKFILT